MEWEVGQRFKREGTNVYLWLIHVDVWQKPTWYCKTIILQLKMDKFKKRSSIRAEAGDEWVTCKSCSMEPGI